MSSVKETQDILDSRRCYN